MLLAVVIAPMIVGAALGASGPLAGRFSARSRRLLSGSVAALTLLVILAVLGAAASDGSAVALRWGDGLAPSLELTPVVRVPAFLAILVGLPIIMWAAAHEELHGIERLIGGLLAFIGAMELLVLAGDLLALAIGWELVGGLSWLLIAHRWFEEQRGRAAAYAFTVTRMGGLGLLVAAGAAWASTGSLAFVDLPAAARGPWGDLLAAGILLAVVTKSAQVPFSPWLFRAMQGPSAVSALLHSSTMVAAGAWLLVRLHTPLEAVPWFHPVVLGIGLTTAWAGGLVACFQSDIKRLLAASTASHYGLMFAAVGAGAAGVALAHLVMHAIFKALLFVVAGTAITAAGTRELPRMRLGHALPFVALVSLVGVLSLAGVPPLGGAWSKDHLVAALGRRDALLAVLTIGAGGLAAWYAARLQRLAFGRDVEEHRSVRPPSRLTQAALALLAGYAILSCALWVPSVGAAAEGFTGLALPQPRAWETVLSLAVIGFAAAGGWVRASPLWADAAPSSPRLAAAACDWFHLPTAIDRVVVTPALGSANACVRLERRLTRTSSRAAAAIGDEVARWLAAGAQRGRATAIAATATLRSARLSTDVLERGVDRAAHRLARALAVAGVRVRRVHTGAVPLYYALVVGGLAAFVALLALGR